MEGEGLSILPRQMGGRIVVDHPLGAAVPAPNDQLRAAREATTSPQVPGAAMSRSELARPILAPSSVMHRKKVLPRKN